MFDESTLAPQNGWNQLEAIVKHPFGAAVRVLKANTKVKALDYTRFIHLNATGIADACVIVNGYGIIASVYTAPEVRRQGIAKQLLAVAGVVLKKAPAWDENLTEEGFAFKKAVTK